MWAESSSHGSQHGLPKKEAANATTSRVSEHSAAAASLTTATGGGTSSKSTTSKSASGNSGTSNSTYPRSSDSSGNASSNGGDANSNSPLNEGSDCSGNEGQEAASPGTVQFSTDAKASGNEGQEAAPPGLDGFGTDASGAAFQAPLGQPMKVETTVAPDRLQHATEMLQAALAYWESCLQSTGVPMRPQLRQPAPYAALASSLPPQLAGQLSAAQLGSLPPQLAGQLGSLPPGPKPECLNMEALGSTIQNLANSQAAEEGSVPSRESALGIASDLLHGLAASTSAASVASASTSASSSDTRLGPQLLQAHHDALRSMRQQEECARNSLKVLQQQQQQHPQPQGSWQAAAATAKLAAATAAKSCNSGRPLAQSRPQPSLTAAAAKQAALNAAAHSTAVDAAERAAAAWQQLVHEQPDTQPLPSTVPSTLPPAVQPGPLSEPPGVLSQPRQCQPAHAPASGAGKANGRNAQAGGGRRTQSGAAAQHAGPNAEETLRTHLRELQQVASDRVLIVRRINRLGFQSAELLTSHYSQFGTVSRVLVSHSHVRSQTRRLGTRLRPSGLGFVVMSRRQEAEAILSEGPEQLIKCSSAPQGVTIRVQSFESRASDDLVKDEPEVAQLVFDPGG